MSQRGGRSEEERVEIQFDVVLGPDGEQLAPPPTRERFDAALDALLGERDH